MVINAVTFIIILVHITCTLVSANSQDSNSDQMSFLAFDNQSLYQAVLFDGSSGVDMSWTAIVETPNLTTSVADFDFDSTRRRLVFAITDHATSTVSISDCYLGRHNDAHLSCSLSVMLLYRQIFDPDQHRLKASNVSITLDWINGDVYILLPQLFVRCPLPTKHGFNPNCQEQSIDTDLNPSIVKIDPFSRDLIIFQKDSTKSGVCGGISRLPLSRQNPFNSSECLIEDSGITSIFVNFTSGALSFANGSRDSIFGLKSRDTIVVTRKLANDGYADSLVNCPFPVRSLTYFDKTDVHFWISPDSGLLAFEVDGFCSSHPTGKKIEKIQILYRPIDVEKPPESTSLIEVFQCQGEASSLDFSIYLNCDWELTKNLSDDEGWFYLIEIGNRVFYRVFTEHFSAFYDQSHLEGDLDMSNSITLHVTLRVCTKWHCSLPANVYLQQSPFAPSNVEIYKTFVDTEPDSSVLIKWKLPKLFQAVTSVTLRSTPENFAVKTSESQVITFTGLPKFKQFSANIETCNIWNCSTAVNVEFQPADLSFQPLKLCWNNFSTNFHVRNNSGAVVGTISGSGRYGSGITSAVFIPELNADSEVGSSIWIDATDGRIYLTESNNMTNLLVDSGRGSHAYRFQRHSLGFDYVSNRLFWIETDAVNQAKSGLHSIHLSAITKPNQQHSLATLPEGHNWQRVVVNSTLGVIYFISNSQAFVFDLNANQISRNASLMSVPEPTSCQPFYDENIASIYDNRVCFNFGRTELGISNISTSTSLTLILKTLSNKFCHSSPTLERLLHENGYLYLVPAGGNYLELCHKNSRHCLKRKFHYFNMSATFEPLQPFQQYEVILEALLPRFNQSRTWKLGQFRTLPSTPSEPRAFECGHVTPEEITLMWRQPETINGPENHIQYILRWNEPLENDETKLVGRSMEIDGSKPVMVTHLKPDRLYEFKLVARSHLFPSSRTSLPVFARCRSASIGNFRIVPMALERSKLSYRFSPSQFVSRRLESAVVTYGPAADLRYCSNSPDKAAKFVQICSGPSCSRGQDVVRVISDLQPKTFYRFCLILNLGSDDLEIYPKYGNIVVETGGFKLDAPRVWTSFAGVEVLMFSSEPLFNLKSYSSSGYQLLYSNDQSICRYEVPRNMSGVYSRNFSKFQRSVALSKDQFEINTKYWFRLSLSIDDQVWLSGCSDPITIRLPETSTNVLALVNRHGIAVATGLIALISCASVIAFCISTSAFVYFFRRFLPECKPAKELLVRYFSQLLHLSRSKVNPHGPFGLPYRQKRRTGFIFSGRSRCASSGLPIYNASNTGATPACQNVMTGATMTLINAGRGHQNSRGLWSLSTMSPDTSPLTASSTGNAGVFSFDCDNTGGPLRFFTLSNQIYSSPSSLSNWISTLPSNVLKLNRDDIELSRFLGAGAFGEVYEGELHVDDASKKVAIKTLKPDADSERRSSFCREAALMSQFNHPNIVKLIGMCVAPSAPGGGVSGPLSAWPLMVLELMGEGDLLGYLRRARSITEKLCYRSTSTADCLSINDLVDICIDVASGCRYLEKRRFCHRDIAARNCLVTTENGRRVVKIGDFGLARSIDGTAECYRKVGEGLLPVRWMSPESLNDGIFTTQSDVWSFGVLMYEVFSLGRQPYAGRANQEVFEMVKCGSHPECPRDCPTPACSLMLSCFQVSPDDRPSFKRILSDFKAIRANAGTKKVLSRSCQSLRADYATLSRLPPNACSTLKRNYASMRHMTKRESHSETLGSCAEISANNATVINHYLNKSKRKVPSFSISVMPPGAASNQQPLNKEQCNSESVFI